MSAPSGAWDTPRPSAREARGPSQVERRVVGGRVAWIEPRGETPNPGAPYMRGPSGGGLEFARVLAPDPQSHLRLLVRVGALKRYGVPAGEEAVCFASLPAEESGTGETLLARAFWFGVAGSPSS